MWKLEEVFLDVSEMTRVWGLCSRRGLGLSLELFGYLEPSWDLPAQFEFVFRYIYYLI